MNCTCGMWPHAFANFWGLLGALATMSTRQRFSKKAALLNSGHEVDCNA